VIYTQALAADRYQPAQVVTRVRGSVAIANALRWPSTVEELLAQPVQGSRIVDIVPGGQRH
jgi:hypothetical protein